MLDYGIIGNCMTCALIHQEGSIDWMCSPHFDSPSLFCKILDEKGGSFAIEPSGDYTIEQSYVEDTAILTTTFESDRDSFVVYDFFPRYKALTKKNHEKLIKRNELVRIVQPVRGRPRIRVRFDPQPDYAREKRELVSRDDRIVNESDTQPFALITNARHESVLNGEEIVLNATKHFVLGPRDMDAYTGRQYRILFNATKRYWKEWVATLTTPQTHREHIIRSAITLKLLTYSRTGAIVAAPTTSIPEEIGSERTWDYRFVWVRDAALCADALKKIGREYEPKQLMNCIMRNVHENDSIQIMYGIHGETQLEERELAHLSGFEGSKPVRIGNAAYKQTQHDIYGQLLDIIYLYYAYYEYEKKLPTAYWRFIVYLVDQIRSTWRKPDSGIWEFRGLLRHYTYSKFMCYVGVDRAIKTGQFFDKDEHLTEWVELRDEIREDILHNAYDRERNAFTMYYSGSELDASLLQMTYHEFLEPTDPRIIGTIRAIYHELRDDHLVKRYDAADDFGESTSSFTICSFWLVDALYTIGEEDKAREIYAKIVEHGNHVGLFSEDIRISTGELLGNFPQAYTHIALINSSILLSEWSAKRAKIPNTPKRNQWL